MAEETPQAKSAAKIYVMPEQFLAVTRGAGLPVQKAPPPPVQPQAASPKPQAPPPQVIARPEKPAEAISAAAAPVAPAPTGPTGPGIPMEEGKRKMIVIWGGVAAVILIGGGLAAFFALRSVKPPAPPTPPAPRNVAPVNVAPVNIPPPAPEPEPEPEPPPPPAPDRDTDEDGLTDAEELLLGTDIGLADSDGDSYPDATELANLYNPAGVAPQRLLDAGLVYAYEHPTQGWAIYLPRAWSIAATDQEQTELKVTTQVSDESFVIMNRGAEVGASLCRELQGFQTKRGANGCRNPSETIVFIGFQLGNTLSIEHRIVTPPARYPHIFDMMVQSFAATSASL